MVAQAVDARYSGNVAPRAMLRSDIAALAQKYVTKQAIY
jgi:hypothetical protein